MKPKSDAPDRPYMHKTDLGLADALAFSERMLHGELENELRETTNFRRNHLIEEILFRYQNPS